MSAAIYLLSLVLMSLSLQTRSRVQLRDHGYENVIIAVDPRVPENAHILTTIKDMVSEASFYLFNATKRRFFYREVKILIPNTWKSFNFQRPRYEVHQKASVIISSPNLNYGNDPYTLHYKGCGSRGSSIHFTPDFLLNDELLPVYGPKGKVFLHEWAHFQWGVFDEYNYEKPFFVSVDDKIKATRYQKIPLTIQNRIEIILMVGIRSSRELAKTFNQEHPGTPLVIPGVVVYISVLKRHLSSTKTTIPRDPHKQKFETVPANQRHYGIQRVRCSSEMAGMYICKKRSCSDGQCIIDPHTGNLEEGCMFLANRAQKAKTSIMYMQSLSSIAEFCSERDHDKEAPNMQNKICSYRSTWDVIESSTDYKTTGPMSGTELPPPPSFILLQSRVRVICLVLDISDNMAMGQQFHRLRQAAAIFLQQLVELGSHVGIVTFNETTEVKSPLRQIVSDEVRWTLASSLPETFGGGMSVCEGISAGLQVIKGLDGITEGSEMILAVSGRDSNLQTCLSKLSESGSVVHTIAIGSNADPELESLAKSTGGKMFFTSNNNDSDNLIGAFTEIFPVNSDPTDTFIKITSVQTWIQVDDRLSGSVIMDKTVGNDTVFIITWQADDPPNVTIQDPLGYGYTNENLDHNLISQVSYLKVPGTSQVGSWTYTITNLLNNSQVLGILVISRPSSHTSPPVTITGEWIDERITSPQPVTVYAELKQGHRAVLGATVTAVIEPESGEPILVTLNDSGAGADTGKNDGIYSKYVFWFPTNGRYALKILATWTNAILSVPTLNNRAMYVPGYIENGTINMNPPKPLISSGVLSPNESFSRIHFLGSFKVTNVSENTVFKDVFPPCKVVDLEARLENDHAVLSWTAPGDNYDQGSASSYEIRMSSNPLDLRQQFSRAEFINASSLQPKNAGSRETFSFKLNNMTGDKGVITYIAIRSTDQVSQQSEISNLVHVTRHALQEKDINFAYSSAIAKFNTTTLIAISACVLSLCLVLGAGLYFWRKHDSYKLLSLTNNIELQEIDRTMQETQSISECQDEELLLKISKDDILEETIIILEGKTDI